MTMKAIEKPGEELNWIHPEVGKQEYELRSGGELVADLKWQPAPQETIAIGKAAAGMWTFKQLGFLNPHVIVQDASSKKQIARFDATWSGGGLVELFDGRHFRWSSNLWRAEWGWIDSSGDEIVKFKRSFEVIEKNEGYVQIDQGGADSPHTPVLVLLGWYLIILLARTAPS